MEIKPLCVLQIMRMVEALEGKGLHMALTRGEAKLSDHLRGLTRQVSCAHGDVARLALSFRCGVDLN
jgi:nuclear pore complex protein Nup54